MLQESGKLKDADLTQRQLIYRKKKFDDTFLKHLLAGSHMQKVVTWGGDIFTNL